MSNEVVPESAFHPDLDIRSDAEALNFLYGDGVFHPAKPELRRLRDILPSLPDPNVLGPESLYAIAMDVGRKEHADELRKRQLLFGVVLYEAGSIGDGPVRSQGHVHKICPHNGWSGPELVEVWQGSAIVLLQQFVADDPGVCIAVSARVGDKVVIPPGWAHCIINAGRTSRMMFGAFCDCEYGFEYSAVRSRNGLAWVPNFDGDGSIRWTKNERYGESSLVTRAAREYPELSVASGTSIYKLFSESPDCVQWVSDPGLVADIWDRFIP